ncbi:hypothetical protein [Dyadobacter sp. BHUBP1]|uniref:hypothetical protein n=1 Tax=Dyadobacter sp. BHUBP1 TaxID=3424178 RepID=UPI003D33436F
MENSGVEYIIPPNSKLCFNKKNGALKERFGNFYLEFNGLTGKYSSDISRLDDGIGWFWKSDLLEKKPVNGCRCSEFIGTNFKWRFIWKKGNSKLLLQFDFNSLVRKSVKANFDLLFIELIKSLADVEGVGACACIPDIVFPVGFSQQLAKRLREYLPLPIDLVQAGTGFTIAEGKYTFMLLDDDYPLLIDNVEKSEISVGSDRKFQYNWNGTNLFYFQRDEFGAITQNMFAKVADGLPTNIFEPHTYKISSFADIQSSDELKGIYYVGLIHPPLKRNNDISRTSSLGMYSVKDDKKIAVGNPILLHFRSDQLSELNFNDLFGGGSDFTRSFFNERGSITPMIRIYINGEQTLVGVQTRPGDLTQLPRNFTLFRRFKIGYRKVQGTKTKMIFLPNDHLIYKP